MATHRRIDCICCVILAATLLLTAVFLNGKALGLQTVSSSSAYADRLFDSSKVHTIDIVIDDWDSFLDTALQEEYQLCSLVIDGESYRNVAIRAKGNTSLTSVAAYGNDRYSFKVEFDHYDSASTYYGLDKLNLNNIIQDNTYLKDFLSYQMMNAFGVAAPLTSYVWITVNGEDWGLYLAVEGVEESFLSRNYGSDYGELYKPDSTDMGGGRGNGGGFAVDRLEESDTAEGSSNSFSPGNSAQESPAGSSENIPSDAADPPAFPGGADEENSRGRPGGIGGTMGNSDVSLIYTDDDFDSYSNIFDNAKTDITDSDKTRLIASLKTLNEGTNPEQVVNTDAVIRYFVVHNFLCNFDSYTGSMIHNYYLYEENGILSMIPWDYNLAFGGFQSGGDATDLVNYPIDTPVSGGSVEDRPMLAWIFADETWTEAYHQSFAQFLSTVFDSGWFTELLEQTIALISPYVEKDPTAFCTYDEFTAGVETLRSFCTLRAESIQGQLDGTIPSTSDGQAADDSVLIDASDLNISDMGSMAGGGQGGGMMGQNQPHGFPGQMNTDSPEDTSAFPDSAAPQDQTDGTSSPPFQNGDAAPGNQDSAEFSPNEAAPNLSQSSSSSDNVPFPSSEIQETGQLPSFSQSSGSSPLNKIPSGQGGEQPGSNGVPFPSEQSQDEAQAFNRSSALFLTGLSCLILLAGILLAARFRRRGR